MSRLSFSTTSCSNYGHPEITLTFAQPPPISGLEAGLLSYFEAEVSRGTRFLPGETVQAGWLLLRMCKRADGTLGVQELDPKAPEGWVEAVDRSLVQSWYQEQVVKSLGLGDPSFSGPSDHALICSKLLEGGPEYLLSRTAPQDAEDSGWFLGCVGKGHDHEEGANLALARLVDVVTRLPLAAQFLALPVGTTVRVVGPGRIRVQVFLEGEECQPLPGSYLALLNSEVGR